MLSNAVPEHIRRMKKTMVKRDSRVKHHQSV